MIAKRLSINTQVGFHLRATATIPRGTNTKRMFAQSLASNPHGQRMSTSAYDLLEATYGSRSADIIHRVQDQQDPVKKNIYMELKFSSSRVGC